MKRRAKDKRYTKRITLPDGSKKDLYGHTQDELAAKVEETKRLAGMGVNVNDNPTVAEWCKRWVEGYFKDLRPTTQSTYTTIYNAHVSPMIGGMRLRDVQQINIQAIMSAVAAQSESAQKNVLSCVRRLFNVARANRIIAFNPCDGVKITERSDEESAEEVLMALDDQQRAALLQAVTGTPQELFVNLEIWCGLRREESLGLQWQYIDWNNSVLYVRKSVTYPGNAGILSDKLKHKASRREIPIPPPLMELLQTKNPQHLDALPLVLHHKQAPDETVIVAQVCPSAHGQIMSKSAYDKFWAHVTDAVSFEVRSHMLRHTYCTWLYDNGVDVQTAKALMGHSDIRITSNIYTQIGEKQHKNARAKIQGIFQDSVKIQSNRDL